LATDGVAALVVDPQRDIDRVLAAAAAPGPPRGGARPLASLLHAAGRAVTAVDDDFGRAGPAGLPLATALPVSA
jgi:hypothetical protein